jgi:hypothetical protein
VLVSRAAAAEECAALADGLVEEPASLRRGHQRAHRERPRRLAEDRHVVRVAPEGRHVVLDPLQRGHHVEQAEVAADVAVFRCHAGMRQEAEHAQPMVGGDEDDVLLHEVVSVMPRLGCRTGLKPAAVNPDHHGPRRRGGGGRRPDVQVQTIFAGRPVEDDVAEDRALHAVGTELGGLAHARPWDDRLRRLPPEVAHRRRRERNALEDACLAVGDGRAFDLTRRRPDLCMGG